MKLIESKTLATAAASIEFTSIPQDGTDLLLLLSLRGTNSAVFDQPRMTINGSTSGYSYRALVGDGAAVSAGDASSSTTSMKLGVAVGANATSNTFSNTMAYLPNYTGSSAKSCSSDDVGENNATTAYQSLYASLWSGTSAITSLQIFSQNATNWVAGSTISLYKITKGSDGIVTTS
jgi:hypothetical protein